MDILDFLSKPLEPSTLEEGEDTGKSEFYPRHYYDYRGAYEAGARLDKNKHLPSKFKHDLHPDRYTVDEKDLSIYDTKYDKPAKFEDLIIQSFKRKDYEESIWRK